MRALTVAIVGALALLVSPPTPSHAAAPFEKDDRDTKVWSDKWDIPGRPVIRVRAHDARVAVHGRSGGPVEVRVRYSGSTTGFLFGRRHEPNVSMSRQGSTVDVVVEDPHVSGILVISNTRLEVDVWTPRESDVHVRTGDGRVTAEGLAGRIGIQTGDGSLVVDVPVLTRGVSRRHSLRGELNGGGPPLRLRSRDGGVRVSALD